MKLVLTYYPWITQHKTPEQIRHNIEIFAAALQTELEGPKQISGFTIEVAPAMEVPEQINSITSGQSHIALMNPLGFVFARKDNPAVEASVVALRIIDRQIGDSYFAQIYTHIDNHLPDLPSLKKKSIGYGSSQSTSNFIIPAFDLKDSNIHPFAAFKRIEFIGGHDSVAKAVYNKQIESGAGHDGVIIDLANQAGFEDAKDKLIRIHRSDPIPSDPIAVNIPDKDAREFIQKALVEISTVEPAKSAIAEFWGNAQGLKATDYKPYEYLLNAVQDLGLNENDIFGG